MVVHRLYSGDVKVDRRTLVRSGAGDLKVTITPDTTGELKPVSVSVTNKDTVAREVRFEVHDASDNVLALLYKKASVAADETVQWPQAHAEGELRDPPQDFTVPTGAKLVLIVASVADTQDAIFNTILRYSGAVPTYANTTGA